MIETTYRRSTVVLVISVLTVGEAFSFFLFSLLHLGIQFPLGISEPFSTGAGVVEGLCWLVLTICTYAIFAQKTWAWSITVAAHIFAVLSVLLGIYTTLNDPGDQANFIFHRVILVTLAVVLALLATSRARAELGRRKRSFT